MDLQELELYKVSQGGRKAYKDIEGNIYMKCTKCDSVKSIDCFHKKNGGFLGKVAYCSDCDNKRRLKHQQENPEMHSKNNKKYAQNNRDKINANSRRWRKNNLGKVKVWNQLRRARKLSLPHTITFEEEQLIKERYNNVCAFTLQECSPLSFEHVIPLSIGHEGTTYENTLFIHPFLNSSKSNKNVFEWAETNYERLGFTLERFYSVMTEVAARYEMTLEEYREYVYWCHENPRPIELEA